MYPMIHNMPVVAAMVALVIQGPVLTLSGNLLTLKVNLYQYRVHLKNHHNSYRSFYISMK